MEAGLVEDLKFKLVFVKGGSPGTAITIPKGEVVIGSGSHVDLLLAYEGVSRRHAVFTCANGRVFVADLGSLNGTWVNGHRIVGQTQLADRDLLQLGRIELRFIEGQPESRTARFDRVSVSPVSNSQASSISGYPSSEAASRESYLPRPKPTAASLQPSGKRSTVTPWYRRSKSLVLSAGALAAALLTVVNIWDRFFPPNLADVAKIESVQIVKQTTLGSFAQERIGKDLPLKPAPAAAGENLRLEADVLAGILVEAITSTPQPLAATTQPSLIANPTTEITASPSGTSTAPSEPSPAETSSTPPFTPPKSGTSTPTPTATKTRVPGTPSDKYLDTKVSELPSEEYAASVRQQPALEDIVPKARVGAARILVRQAIDEKGEFLPPAQAARNLAQALLELDKSDSKQGKDPLGWTLAVRLDLEGLADIPMLLTWSLDGVHVSESWRADNLAYRITATTPHDAGIAEIWIPNLERAGAYNVNVKLSFESNGLIADAKQLKLLND